MKSVDDAKRERMINSIWTHSERFPRAKLWNVLGKQTERWYSRQREAVWSQTWRCAIRCVSWPAINDKVIPCQCREMKSQMLSRPDRACAPKVTERFPLYAVVHGTSLKNFKHENVMILCSFLFFKNHLGKRTYGNNSTQIFYSFLKNILLSLEIKNLLRVSFCLYAEYRDMNNE